MCIGIQKDILVFPIQEYIVYCIQEYILYCTQEYTCIVYRSIFYIVSRSIFCIVCRSIFVCIGMQEKEESWLSEFTLMPYGACHQVIRRAEDWVEYTQPYTDNWTTRYSR